MKKTTILLVLTTLLSVIVQARILYATNPLPLSIIRSGPEDNDTVQRVPASPSMFSPPTGSGIKVKTSVKKQGFWNRLALRMVPKKYRTELYKAMQDTAEADKKAKNSMIIGGIAIGLALIPYTFWLAIPFGIVALVMSGKARKMGTKKKTGKWLGIAALLIVAVWLIVAAFYTGAAFGSLFGL